MQKTEFSPAAPLQKDTSSRPSEKTAVYPNSRLSLLKLTSQPLRDAFDRVVQNSLPVYALLIGAIHICLALFFMIAPEIEARNIVVGASLGAGGIATLNWLLMRHRLPPAHLANGGLLFLTGLALTNALIYLYLSAEMRQTMLVLFIVIGISQFFLSIRYYLLALFSCLSAWLIVAWQLPSSPVYFGFLLIMGAVASLIMFIGRRQAHQEYELLRMQDQARQDELFHRARQLEISQGLGQSVVSILELDSLLQQVVDLIQREYGHDYVGIFLLGENGRLHHKADNGLLSPTVDNLAVDGKSLLGWVAKNGRFLLTDDVQRDSRFIDFKPQLNIRASLDLPLKMGQTLLGVLTLQSQKTAAFRHDDIPYFQLVATQVAIALYNASLYQREKSARRLAETLRDTGHILTSSLEWNEVIDAILEGLSQLVQYDRGAVLVQNGRLLKFVAARGFPTDFDPMSLTVSLDNDSIFRQIVDTKRPFALTDAQEWQDWQRVDSLPAARSWLGVPLIRSGEVMGMLSLTREHPTPYTAEERDLAVAFAGQAAISLENARLYRETTRFNQQLEYEVQQRTEAIQKAYFELEELNRKKSDFISVVSHELRTPLTILHGYTQMLLKDKALLEDDMRKHFVYGIRTGSVRLEEIISSMLDVVKIENKELSLYPTHVSLSALLAMVTQEYCQVFEERNLTFTQQGLSELPIIQADPDMLQKVLTHLLTNAIKYTPNGGSITVSGKFREQLNDELQRPGIEIIFADTGVGVSPDIQELIFTKFYQTGEVSLHSSSKTQFKGGGPGLGLAIAKGIIEAHGGRIWIESSGHDEQTNPGSQFFIHLPV